MVNLVNEWQQDKMVNNILVKEHSIIIINNMCISCLMQTANHEQVDDEKSDWQTAKHLDSNLNSYMCDTCQISVIDETITPDIEWEKDLSQQSRLHC